MGNLNYSFITDSGDPKLLSMDRFTGAVVKALENFGLKAEASGRNDILVEGKKVSGTAQRLMNGRILYHGTLLFDSSPDMVEGALNVDPEKFKSKSSKSVRSRIGNIRSFLPCDMELVEFWKEIKRQLSGDRLIEEKLSIEELAEVEKLKSEKYSTWEWNFGRSPKYGLSNKRRFDGGTLEVDVHVEEGKIADIAFYGDFMAMGSLLPLAEELKGCRFIREDMREILSRFSLKEMFGGITADEILDTVFYAGDKM
jgi:lipoate-protein ligase A